MAIKDLGVSLAIPLSTAGQIVANALMAAAVLGEWKTAKMWAIGVISIITVVIGATLISARDKSKNSAGIEAQEQRTGLRAYLPDCFNHRIHVLFCFTKLLKQSWLHL